MEPERAETEGRHVHSEGALRGSVFILSDSQTVLGSGKSWGRCEGAGE